MALHRTFLIAFLALLAALPLAAQQRGVTVELKAREARDAPVVERVQLYPRSYALVIGNDDYRDPFWVKLSNGVRDARAVAAALEAKGFQVTLKENLDGDALEDALESFFYERGQDFDARLFVWYAGHGHTEAGEGYLVPIDAPDPEESGSFRRRALSLRRMGEYARGANAHHVLAVFDSCFAGTVFDVQRDAPPAAITHATTRPVRQFITSGDAGQTVSDDGTFRRMFIEAVGGERRADLNRDGYVTASELGLFLSDRITNYTEGTQTPRYGKLRDPNWDQGDFVFSLAALAKPQQPAVLARPSPAANPCLLVWQGIADSERRSDFEAFLNAYPDCLMAPIARSRLETLPTEPQVAVRTPPDKSEFAVEERDETLAVLRNANVRSLPSTDGEKLTTLRRGAQVAVTGSVADRDWFRVALEDGKAGYVWAPLLGELPAGPGRDKEPETRVAVGTYSERRAPGTVFKDCVGCPELLVLPAGSFSMGTSADQSAWLEQQGVDADLIADEKPQHRVVLSSPVAVGRYEVTRRQFADFVAATGHQIDDGCSSSTTSSGWQWHSDKNWRDPGYVQTERDPVVCVSWRDAKAYVDWLSRKTGQDYRLLSEAEWEYAARAGTSWIRYWGNDENGREACGFANVADEGRNESHKFDCQDGHRNTSPVASYPANGFGLYDMLGNVWEWTEDCYRDNYNAAPSNGAAWTSDDCQERVLRGGSWLYGPDFVRSAERYPYTVDKRDADIGIRVARTLSF